MEAARKETKVPQVAPEPSQPEKPKEPQIQKTVKAKPPEFKNPVLPSTKQPPAERDIRPFAKASVLNLTANFGRSLSHSGLSPRNGLLGSVSAPDVSLLLK